MLLRTIAKMFKLISVALITKTIIICHRAAVPILMGLYLMIIDSSRRYTARYFDTCPWAWKPLTKPKTVWPDNETAPYVEGVLLSAGGSIMSLCHTIEKWDIFSILSIWRNAAKTRSSFLTQSSSVQMRLRQTSIVHQAVWSVAVWGFILYLKEMVVHVGLSGPHRRLYWSTKETMKKNNNGYLKWA